MMITAARISSWLLGAVFLAAAIAKTADTEQLLGVVERLPLTDGLVPWVVAFVLSLELVLGFHLVLKPAERLPLYLATGLLGVFSIFHVGSLYFPDTFASCACFGKLDRATPEAAMVRTMMLFCYGLLCLYLNRCSEPKKIDSYSSIST